jgi:hypothetical protein
LFAVFFGDQHDIRFLVVYKQTAFFQLNRLNRTQVNRPLRFKLVDAFLARIRIQNADSGPRIRLRAARRLRLGLRNRDSCWFRRPDCRCFSSMDRRRMPDRFAPTRQLKNGTDNPSCPLKGQHQFAQRIFCKHLSNKYYYSI